MHLILDTVTCNASRQTVISFLDKIHSLILLLLLFCLLREGTVSVSVTPQPITLKLFLREAIATDC